MIFTSQWCTEQKCLSKWFQLKKWLDDFHIGNAILGNPWPFDAGSPPGIDRAAKGPDPPNEGLQPDRPKDRRTNYVVRESRCWTTPIHRRKRSLPNEEIHLSGSTMFYSVNIHFVKTQRSCFVDFLPKHKFWSANVVVDLAWRFKLAQVQIKTFAGFHRIL